LFQSLMEQCLATIEKCPCREGCPSCVGLAVTQPPQQMDLDLGRGYPIPDKEAALVLLSHLLGRKPHVPAARKRRRGARRPPRKAEGAQESETAELPRDVSVGQQVVRRLRGGRRGRVGL